LTRAKGSGDRQIEEQVAPAFVVKLACGAAIEMEQIER
jgi:hypothetical protein